MPKLPDDVDDFDFMDDELIEDEGSDDAPVARFEAPTPGMSASGALASRPGSDERQSALNAVFHV